MFVVVRMAWRNLFVHKTTNVVVALLMMFATLLVVVGSSTLDSIEASMTRSVTGSIAGHLQVYDREARDELALFGGGFMGRPDIGTIPDFERVKTTLLALDDVRAVVPMGIDMAELYTTTELDQALESLRRALDAGDPAAVARLEHKVRAMAALMEGEYQSRRKIARNLAEVDQQLADIRYVSSDAFWAELRRDPLSGLRTLDTRLAPLVDETEGLGLSYIGTDLEAFMANFDRFELVSGTRVPPGARGVLVNHYVYEESLKNKVARLFDAIAEAVRDEGRSIAGDPLLQDRVAQMVRQYRRVTFQLEPDEAAALEPELRALVPDADPAASIDVLVQRFLTVDDATLAARHAFFTQSIVPRIKLHVFAVGDVITLRTYTQSGYPRSANIKVYGTFSFRGLEDSALAGTYSLMDIVTFRELYGVMSDERRAELADIKAAVAVKDVAAADAEAALFGADSDVAPAAPAAPVAFEAPLGAAPATPTAPAAAAEAPYDQGDIDRGLALNAAIVLRDPARLEVARARIEAALAQAGLGLRVVDWRAATGFVGQFVSLAGVILFVAIAIIFLVAIVIMNNTMVMTTLERTTEIGTIRAIGGSRLFVVSRFLIETLLLGALAGLVGAMLGFGLMQWLGSVGIPAPSEELVFLFSGSHLYPVVTAAHVVFAVVLILGVSLVATFYPALLAARIQPVVAMQAGE